MDWSSFGMSRRPFCPAVDTASYFPAATHESALAALSGAFARSDRAILIDGPPGTGKSLVARRWLEAIPSEVPRVLLPNTNVTRPADLFQAILFDLNMAYEGKTEQELRLAVTGQLLTLAGSGHPVVALIDEAQHLSHSALEELRLLGNIEVGGSSALFLVLVALPSLRESLGRPAYESVAQHVAQRCRIEPMSKEESADYLRHQVRAAGGNAGFFEEDALAMLAGACEGIPRILNSSATLALELAGASGADRVDVEAAMEALQRLDRSLTDCEEPSPAALLTHPAATAAPVRLPRLKTASSRGSSNADELQPARQTKQKAARKRSA